MMRRIASLSCGGLPACRFSFRLPANAWFSRAALMPSSGRPSFARWPARGSTFLARTLVLVWLPWQGAATLVGLVSRRIEAEDFRGAALAIVEAESAAEAAEFQAAARAAGVVVNVIDKPRFSDFQFGAIVDRSPLVIGISTGGGAPVLAQAIRGRLEALLPREIKLWAQIAKVWREKLKLLDTPAKTRRRFWELFSGKALAARHRPADADLAMLLAEAEAGTPAAGSVALAGAGPGDPELLTLKALRALQSADVVLYDDLVSPAIVDMARREAEKIPVGKRGYQPSCRQDHIVSQLVSLAGQGKRVVRLKGGDPMIFGRANEEIVASRAARIPIEIIQASPPRSVPPPGYKFP